MFLGIRCPIKTDFHSTPIGIDQPCYRFQVLHADLETYFFAIAGQYNFAGILFYEKFTIPLIDT